LFRPLYSNAPAAETNPAATTCCHVGAFIAAATRAPAVCFLLVERELDGLEAVEARLVVRVLVLALAGFLAAVADPVSLFTPVRDVPPAALLAVAVVRGLPGFLVVAEAPALPSDVAVEDARVRRCFVPLFGPGFFANVLPPTDLSD